MGSLKSATGSVVGMLGLAGSAKKTEQTDGVGLVEVGVEVDLALLTEAGLAERPMVLGDRPILRE